MSKKTKKVVYEVQCNEGHTFEKVFEIEEGSENIKTKVQTYCPHCEKYVTYAIQGKVVPDQEVLRRFDIS